MAFFSELKQALRLLRADATFIRSDIRMTWRLAAVQSSLGYFWQIFMPLLPISVYVFLGAVKILPSPDNMPGEVYIILGYIVWATMSDSLLGPTRMLQKHRQAYNKTSVSFIGIVSTHFFHKAIELLIQWLLAIIIMYVYFDLAALNGGLALIMIVPGWVLMFSVGIFIAVIGTFVPDCPRIVEVINKYMLFVSAVIFPLPNVGFLQIWKEINPYIVFINEFRSSWMQGFQPVASSYIAWSTAAVIVLLIALVVAVRVDKALKGVL